MNEKTMGAIPVSALERLEQSAVKLSLITFCLRHEELKAAPDAAEIHSIKSDLSRADSGSREQRSKLRFRAL